MIAANQISIAPSQVETVEHVVGVVHAWSFLRRRMVLLLLGLVAGTGVGAVYYFRFATPLYESQAQVLVIEKNAALPSDRGREGATVASDRNAQLQDNLLATHVQIMKSREVITKAIEEGQLKEIASVVAAIAADEDPVEYIQKQLEVAKGGDGEGKNASVIRARFRDPSPQDSERVLTAVVTSYQKYIGETVQGAAAEAVELIAQEKQHMRDELTRAEQAYHTFMESAPLLSRDEKVRNFREERLSTVEKELSTIQLLITETQSRLQAVDEVQADRGNKLSALELLAVQIREKDVERMSLLLSVRQGRSDSEAFATRAPDISQAARAKYEQLLAARLEEKSLTRKYGKDHPHVRAIHEKIRLIESFVGDEKSAPADEVQAQVQPQELLAAHRLALESDLNELKKRERELAKVSVVEQKHSKEIINSEIQAKSLHDELTRVKAEYDAVVARWRDVNLMESYGGFVTNVIRRVEPGVHVAPRLSLSLAIGAVMGALFAGMVAFVIDAADRTFRSPDELRQSLRLPILAHVPRLKSRHRGWRISNAYRRKRPMDLGLVTFRKPRSRQAEAFRGLRTSLLVNAHARGQKVIQITSPNSGDGKTTLVANLAISLAQSGKRVLLVDSEMRCPRLHEMFEVDAGVGLSSLIVGTAEMADAVQPTGIQNLWIVPCGEQPANPSELLSMPRFEEFLNLARETYDFVLLDSAPLLAVSDPSVIAGRVDGVVLVVRVRHNGRPAAVQAREILAAMQIDVLGIVVNSIEQDDPYGAGRAGQSGMGLTYGAEPRDRRYYLEGQATN